MLNESQQDRITPIFQQSLSIETTFMQNEPCCFETTISSFENYSHCLKTIKFNEMHLTW